MRIVHEQTGLDVVIVRDLSTSRRARPREPSRCTRSSPASPAADATEAASAYAIDAMPAIVPIRVANQRALATYRGSVMTGMRRFSGVALECVDPVALAAFYTALTGWPVVYAADDWVSIGEQRDAACAAVTVSDPPATAAGLARSRVIHAVPPTCPGRRPWMRHRRRSRRSARPGCKISRRPDRASPTRPLVGWRSVGDETP